MRYSINLIKSAILQLILITCAHSQATDFVKYQLIDSQDGGPIPFAHIYNESKRIGAISDSAGYFVINKEFGDTLIFIAMGYLGDIHIIDESKNKTVIQIELQPAIYEIEAVNIVKPQTYQQFKHSFLNLDLSDKEVLKELPAYNKYKAPYLVDTNVIYSFDFLVHHPLSALYYRHNKMEKSKRKVWYLQQQELKQPAIDNKFNRRIVQEITGLENNDLTTFIAYCNFDNTYLYESTPYEIVLAIEGKFNEYKACCLKVTSDTTVREK